MAQIHRTPANWERPMCGIVTSSTIANGQDEGPDDGRTPMPTITTKDGTSIFYKDWGAGQPVVFSHGWPLNADAWDDQLVFVASNGYRAIAPDRRGHGRSSQT